VKPYVSVIIAALNEEEAIANVVASVPREIADEVIVVDNGSTDRTAEVAAATGACVVAEPERGYGRAFRAGLHSLSAECEIVVFRWPIKNRRHSPRVSFGGHTHSVNAG